jgi:hypothetical protein
VHKADNLNHFHVPNVLKSGSLNFLEPSGPAQACTRIALPFLYPYLVLSAFSSSAIFLLAATKASVCFYKIYTSAKCISISINQKLMCTIKFQALLIYLNPPTGLLQSKVEKQWQYIISLFQIILNRKSIRQILSYPYCAMDFIQKHFY